MRNTETYASRSQFNHISFRQRLIYSRHYQGNYKVVILKSKKRFFDLIGKNKAPLQLRNFPEHADSIIHSRKKYAEDQKITWSYINHPIIPTNRSNR